MGHLLLTVKRVAQAGLNNGYRVVINTGNDGWSNCQPFTSTYLWRATNDMAPG